MRCSRWRPPMYSPSNTVTVKKTAGTVPSPSASRLPFRPVQTLVRTRTGTPGTAVDTAGTRGRPEPGDAVVAHPLVHPREQGRPHQARDAFDTWGRNGPYSATGDVAGTDDGDGDSEIHGDTRQGADPRRDESHRPDTHEASWPASPKTPPSRVQGAVRPKLNTACCLIFRNERMSSRPSSAIQSA